MAARTPIVVGNWKLHNTIAQGETLVTELKNQLGTIRDVEVGVAPVFTSLSSISKRLGDSKILLGAQDCFYENGGAWTGEVSAPMLVDAGCSFAIVGHSERRANFGDTDSVVARKARAALDGGLSVIVCVGESEQERDSGKTMERVGTQLSATLEVLTSEDLERVVIAYEPVWAIGTGRTATPAQAQEVHAFLRKQMSQRFQGVGAGVRIQYGGSVKPGNAKELMSEADIDGALVGGASLKAGDFGAIVKACSARQS
ncbi:MAG: triose-phosphate isomerase [Myxococcales bacterium]|nr:triose-phosphate isomerase [Myxococcales bacterium]